MSHLSKFRLLATAAPLSLLFAAPGFAQVSAPDAGPEVATSTDPVEEAAEQGDIIVTGSILRSTTSATVSPITVVNAEALDRRGINTIQDAIQNLASSNGPALTNSFSANGAFASGASGVSLRGLSTNSTLVLFDGQRAAYYPLADDGSRNFVDLNTIPDDIVDRIEVLRDGASSTYGADAIAGVVNIITKKQFTGIGGRAEAGISEEGNNPSYRLSLTAGTGDLDTNGFNAYVSGFYYRNESTRNSDLPYPFNSDDLRGVGTGGPNNIVGSRNVDTGTLQGFPAGYDVYVRPYNATNTTAVAGGRNELLNPGAGCRYGDGYRLTAAELADPLNASAPANTLNCTVDITNRFLLVTPNIERFGGSARVTARLGETEAYGMVNFQQSSVSSTSVPAAFRANAPAGILFRPFSTSTLPSAANAPGSYPISLPVYVCPGGIGDASGVNTGCTATSPGSQLNPNNPFAAQGQIARLIGRPITTPTENLTRSRVYRAAFGLNGTVFNDVDFRVDATAMHTDLRREQNGFVFINNLLSSIATGRFNFVNPELNSQATLDFVTPDNINNSSSDLYAVQASVSKSLFELPGGPLQFGAGGAIRYEAIDAPSSNPDINGPVNRYLGINAFGTSGNRTVYSAFAELNAPIVDQLQVNASGRYDSYSSGQSNFSPKIGGIFTPIRQIALRGSYSRGFRIPAFGEANALPTTGFVAVGIATLPQSFLSQYGANCRANNASGCPTYITSYARGLTTLASPDLEPEKSRSYTAGIRFEPFSKIAFTVDYFNIKKTGAIASAPIQPALDAYFAGQPIPVGYNVIPDAPSTEFPNARPRPAFVESALINANTVFSEGIDFAGSAQFEFGNVRVLASAEASYILELSTTFPDGTKQEYQGTLGNYALTAGTGTPEWTGNAQLTVDVEPFSLTANVRYFDGYNLSAEDETGPGTAGQGGLAVDYLPEDVDSYTTLDLTGSFRVNDSFTFYVNVLNVLDDLPPIDPATYGAHLYNAVQGGNGIFGRQFRAGVRVGF